MLINKTARKTQACAKALISRKNKNNLYIFMKKKTKSFSLPTLYQYYPLRMKMIWNLSRKEFLATWASNLD